ncbi:LolA family protein [Lichenicoccus sp.]|uniref:LolA family protein n=1 Tax=Lichenicoccus sp. TaxID=2781899 RepID=UPI003D149102
MIDRPLLLSFALCCAISGVPSRASDSVLMQIMQGLAAQPSRQAHFSMQKHLSSLTAPVLSQGTLAYRRPDHLEQDTTVPQPERLLIEGDSVSISSPGQPTRTLPLDESPALRILTDTLRGTLAGDLGTLRRHFTLDESGGIDRWRIVLHPAGNVAAQVVKLATIDGAGSDVRQIDIVQANGDEQRMTITP